MVQLLLWTGDGTMQSIYERQKIIQHRLSDS